MAWLVVVAQVQAVPAPFGQTALPAVPAGLQVPQVHRTAVPLAARSVVQVHMFELEQHVQLIPVGIREEPCFLDRCSGGFPDNQIVPAAVCEHRAHHLLHKLMHPRAGGEERRTVSPHAAELDHAVREALVLRYEVHGVHPETVNSPVHPPVHHGVDPVADPGTRPVQVRLVARKDVQVVLPGRLMPRPRGSAEKGSPVVGFRTGLAAAEPWRGSRQ